MAGFGGATGAGGRTRANAGRVGDHPPVDRIDVSAYQIPTDSPEGDGTLRWTGTTLVLVEARAAERTGLGYTYAHRAVVPLIRETLAGAVEGCDVMDVAAAWERMRRVSRNHGRQGLVSSAISAVDTALWELKAKILNLPLASLFGERRESVPVYGSGGFTTYSEDRLRAQLRGWVESGIRSVKMKIGEHPDRDWERMQAARDAVGADVGLFVDANGAFDPARALYFAERMSTELDARWFEEPVTSDDLEGLRLLRDRAPGGLAIAAGEYGYDAVYFRRMLDAGAVHVLQADATRCAGYTGFLHAAGLCEAHTMPLSAHAAPLLHLHVCCAAPRVLHLEYFHDHVRIERMLFDGVPEPEGGELRHDPSRAGLGVQFKHADAERYRVE